MTGQDLDLIFLILQELVPPSAVGLREGGGERQRARGGREGTIERATEKGKENLRKREITDTDQERKQERNRENREWQRTKRERECKEGRGSLSGGEGYP